MKSSDDNTKTPRGLTRRQVLRVTASLCSLPLLDACSAFSRDEEHETRAVPGIDVHCHTFNASDLSVRGFVQRVVLGDYEDEVVFEPAKGQEEAFFQGLAGLLVKIISLPSMTARQEMEMIVSGRSESGPELSPQAQKDALRNILTEFIAPMPPLPGAAQNSSVPFGTNYSPILEAIKKEIRPMNPGKAREELAAPETMTESLMESDGAFGRYVRWALGMLSPRRSQVERLISLYGGSEGIRLFTPALVDFEYWLDEAPRSPLIDQIQVMDHIQRRQTDGSMIHCFAPFDPWRQLVDESAGNTTTAMEIVKFAVMEAGFIGVKLYPPMGFYPIDNQKHRLVVPARAGKISNFPSKLDKALNDLYTWCEQAGVPVMAHATDSNDAIRRSAQRAHPRFWEPVFRRYPRLQVNLAHFGGFDEALHSNTPDESWEWTIGKLLKSNHQGVHADLSYMSEFLGNGAPSRDRKRIETLLGEFMDRFDPELEHLMYGSDWIMMGKEPGHEKYALIIRDLLSGIGANKRQIRNYFSLNAIRYLGLENGAQNRKRLEAYYKKHGLELERLNRVTQF